MHSPHQAREERSLLVGLCFVLQSLLYALLGQLLGQSRINKGRQLRVHEPSTAFDIPQIVSAENRLDVVLHMVNPGFECLGW